MVWTPHDDGFRVGLGKDFSNDKTGRKKDFQKLIQRKIKFQCQLIMSGFIQEIRNVNNESGHIISVLN